MPQFTEDWSAVRKYWKELLGPMKGLPNLRFLEIGCFEGRATLWLLENVLTDPTSTITVIDTFQGSPEHGPMGVETAGIFERFERNVRPYDTKVDVAVGRSQDALRDHWMAFERAFDFVYVDGSHAAEDVMMDAVLAWPTLKGGGFMVFDDYAWDGGRREGEDVGPGLTEYQTPRIAVDAFLRVYGDQLSVMHQEYQVAVMKL